MDSEEAQGVFTKILQRRKRILNYKANTEQRWNVAKCCYLSFTPSAVKKCKHVLPLDFSELDISKDRTRAFKLLFIVSPFVQFA